jgi:hypothetical protein
VRALLDGFQRRRHRRATAADNGDMQSATVTTKSPLQPFAHL